MFSSKHRSLSERSLKLPKLLPHARIGPTTHLSPPRTLTRHLEPLPHAILTPIQSAGDLLPAPGFLDHLIEKYSTTANAAYIDLTSKVKAISVSWALKSTYGHLPASRVGGTLTSMQNNIYLFGGQCGDRINELKLLNYETLHWETVNTVKDMETPDPRDGHTCLTFKHYLVIYGGAGAFNSVLHTRTCSPLLHLLDTQTLQWKIHKPLGRLPDPRRNHGAACAGNTMLLYGGISNDHKILSDVQGVNLESMQWFSPKFTKDSVRLGCRHSFCMVSVFHPAMLRHFASEIFNLPSIYDEDFSRKSSGIYVFGGMNEMGNVMNDLYIIQALKKASRADKNLLKVTKIDAIGKPPIARCCHSMALCGKFLMIVGGRNDSLYPGTHQSAVKEIAALNLAACRWETVEIYGIVPYSLWGMASASIGTRFLCFGGMNLKSFAGNELWTMETNQELIDGFEVKKRENPIRIVIRRSTRYNLTNNMY